MFLTLRDDYELSVDDYLEKGAQITMKKKKASLPFISFAVLLLSSLAVLKDTWFQRQLYVAIALFSVVLLFLLYHVRSIHTESLLIIASIGVTVRQSSLLGTSFRFYEVQQIEDVVIVEAITMDLSIEGPSKYLYITRDHSTSAHCETFMHLTKSKIIFQLVLLPKQKDHTSVIQGQSFTSSPVKCRDRLHPLFQCFRPKLKDLQTIYKHIQEKLILPSQKAR